MDTMMRGEDNKVAAAVIMFEMNWTGETGRRRLVADGKTVNYTKFKALAMVQGRE